MRSTRPRVLVRAVLLASGGGWLLWRAATQRRAAGLAGDGSPLALLTSMELLLGIVALLGAALALAVALGRPRGRGPRLELPRQHPADSTHATPLERDDTQ